MDNLKKIISPIEAELGLFEDKFKFLVTLEDNFLKPDLSEFLFSNPKRLRPLFIFLFSKVLKINSDIVFNIALASELVHSASLIHDDIIDLETLRRNLAPLYKKFGAKLAVLEGDFLLSLALRELSKTNLEIINIFSSKIKETILGEISQNATLGEVQDEEKYLNRTFKKTGNLFLAGLMSLFTLKEIEDNKKQTLIDFMKNYSIAFQIQNDIKDTKTNNSDFKNGNYTLPVIYFFRENKNKTPNFEALDKYILLAQNKKDEFKKTALLNLETLEDTIYKKSLIELTKYTLRS